MAISVGSVANIRNARYVSETLKAQARTALSKMNIGNCAANVLLGGFNDAQINALIHWLDVPNPLNTAKLIWQETNGGLEIAVPEIFGVSGKLYSKVTNVDELIRYMVVYYKSLFEELGEPQNGKYIVSVREQQIITSKARDAYLNGKKPVERKEKNQETTPVPKKVNCPLQVVQKPKIVEVEEPQIELTYEQKLEAAMIAANMGKYYQLLYAVIKNYSLQKKKEILELLGAYLGIEEKNKFNGTELSTILFNMGDPAYIFLLQLKNRTRSN